MLTRYVPPILVFPGGFYVDLYRAYKMAQALDTPDPDEMRELRVEMTKEKWQRLVQKSGHAARKKD